MSSLSNNLPTPASSYVCPEGRSRTEYYKEGKKHEKIPGQEHVDIAIGSYKKAAEKGETKALVDYARVIINHKPEFIGEAVAALDQFHDTPEALHLLADLYLAGNGVPHDVDKAISYLMNAHSRGDKMALRRLVSIHLSRNESDKALNLLKKAAANNDGWACLKLGLLTQGEDKEKVYQHLLKGFNAYMREGNSYIFSNDSVGSDAIKFLFEFQKEKKSTPSIANINQAIENFNKSNKNEEALHKLHNALIQESQRGFFDATSNQYTDIGRVAYRIQEFKEAMECFRMGANLGNKDCMYYLGVCLYTGKGCEQDKEKAELLWREAAKGPDGNFFAREEVNRLDGLTDTFEDVTLPPLPSIPQDAIVESNESMEITSDGEVVGALPPLPGDVTTAKSQLVLKDVEREDRIVADKPWHNRAVHWIKGIKTGTIKKVSLIATGVILLGALIFGLAKLVMMIPIVATAHPVQPYSRGPSDIYIERVIELTFNMIAGFFQILASLK